MLAVAAGVVLVGGAGRVADRAALGLALGVGACIAAVALGRERAPLPRLAGAAAVVAGAAAIALG